MLLKLVLHFFLSDYCFLHLFPLTFGLMYYFLMCFIICLLGFPILVILPPSFKSCFSWLSFILSLMLLLFFGVIFFSTFLPCAFSSRFLIFYFFCLQLSVLLHCFICSISSVVFSFLPQHTLCVSLFLSLVLVLF